MRKNIYTQISLFLILMIMTEINSESFIKEGTKENPIKITTVEQMLILSEEVRNGDKKQGIYYSLENDITLPSKYIPIGIYGYSFGGSFDGNYHKITVNIIDDTGSNARVGVFGNVQGTIDEKSEIKNLIVSGIIITTNGGSCVAGVVGSAKNANIINCGNNAMILNEQLHYNYTSATGVAGIIGRSEGGVSIENCYNVGRLYSNGYAAGIIYDVCGTTTITNCYDQGVLISESQDINTHIGGICAMPSAGINLTLKNCYTGGNYKGTFTGMIMGSFDNSMVLRNVWYKGDNNTKWIATKIYNSWNNIIPSYFEKYDDEIVKKLGSAFKLGKKYPILTWQNDEDEHSIYDI